MSGRANQPQVPALDIGQKNVLLRFVKAVDLIDEEYRSSAV